MLKQLKLVPFGCVPIFSNGKGFEFGGDCEDNVEVLDGEKIVGSVLDPCFFPEGLALWTVPIPAGVVRYLDMPTFGALVFMSAQLRGSAYFDGTHCPKVSKGQAMGLPISRAMVTKDIRHLDPARSLHQKRGWR